MNDHLDLIDRLEEAAAPVTGAGVTREGVADRVAARRRARTRRNGVLAAAAAVLVAVVAVGVLAARPDEAPTTYAGPGDPTDPNGSTLEPSTTTTTAEPSVTEPFPTSTTTEPSASATEPSTPPSTVDPATEGWPPQHYDLVQGGRTWIAYLVAVPTAANGGFVPLEDEPTNLAAESLGYEPGLGEIACDQGAVEALGLDDSHGWMTVSIPFGSEDDAHRFVDRFVTETGLPVVGAAEVTTYCLD